MNLTDKGKHGKKNEKEARFHPVWWPPSAAQEQDLDPQGSPWPRAARPAAGCCASARGSEGRSQPSPQQTGQSAASLHEPSPVLPSAVTGKLSLTGGLF